MTQAIDGRLALALAVKLRKLFETEEKFLSFPAGIAFTDSYLEFMRDPSRTALSAQEQLNYKADFSRLANIIPNDGPIFLQEADRFLWDELEEVLTQCSFAEVTLSEQEEGLLREAIDFLTDEKTTEDGMQVPVNSAPVTAYYQYKTLYDEAQRAYLDEKLSAGFATGPAAEQWPGREALLLEEIKRREQDWINLGFKNQVEDYQAIKNNLESRKYLNRYRQAYLDELEISELADLNGLGIGFYTTFFSPLDAFDPTLPWTSVTLTKAEIDALLADAPAELKTLFGAGEHGAQVEEASFEYSNVVLIRPWLKPEFFGARFWRLPSETIVSDGNTPRQGRLPAYITSMIVLRKLRITRRRDAAGPPVVAPAPPVRPPVILRDHRTRPTTTVRVRDHRTGSPTAVRVHDRRAAAAALAASPAVLRAATVAPAPERPSASVPASPGMIASPTKTSFLRVAMPVQTGEAPPDDAALQVALQGRALYGAIKHDGLTIKRLPAQAILPPPRSASADPQLVTEDIDLQGVRVLAYVCKRVPKSPDPDPALRW